MSKARERKREQMGQGSAWSVMLDLLRGGAVGFAASCAILVIAAFLIYSGVLGNEKTDSAVVAACLAGGFAGGAFVVRGGKKAPLPLGLGAGGVLYLVLLAAGGLLYKIAPQISSAGVTACACLCGGGLSGFTGRTGKGRRRK